MRSIIWSVSSDEFKKIVLSNVSYASVLRAFGLKHKGGNGRTLKRRIEKEKISTAHFDPHYERMRNYARSRLTPFADILKERTTYNRTQLKKRLLADGLIENKCNECNQSSNWNGKPLVMILDHINGVCDDNRIENLRLLCPNCNSQTKTFAGRNVKRVKLKHYCIDCGKEITKASISKRCRGCVVGYEKKEILGVEQWIKKNPHPPVAVLLEEIKENGYEATGRKYGVTGNAVRKWVACRSEI